MARSRLALILALALGVRLAVFLGALAVHGDPQAFASEDTDTYVQTAVMLAEHGQFSNRAGSPEIARTPGYPLLLTIGVLAGDVTLVTIGIQILLGVGTVLGVAALARRLVPGSPHVAEWSAAIYALDPLSIVYPSLLLTETLFAALFVAHLIALLAFLHAPDGAVRPAIAGTLAAACTFVRPIAYYWPFVAVAILAWRLRGRAARGCAVFLIAAVLPCALWAGRNAVLTGYHGFSTTGATHLYEGHVPGVVAEHDDVAFEDARATLRTSAAAIDDDAARADYMGREGRRIALEHPGTFVRQYLSGVFRLLAGPGFAEYMQIYGQPAPGGLTRTLQEGLWAERRWLLIGSAVFLPLVLAQLAGALIGAARVRRLAAGSLLLWAVVYFVSLSGGPSSHSRLRHPVMPMLCVLAAAGVTNGGKSRSSTSGGADLHRSRPA